VKGELFQFDVLGLGCVAVDDLIYVEAYPPADVKLAVLRTDRQCGGLTATALVAASRLGSKCAYAGVLGTDDISQFAVSRMQGENIDLACLRQRPEARTVHSFIVVDTTKNTRNVFADQNGAVGADPHWPERSMILGSRVLFVDQFGLPGMIRAARIAREGGRPVVADLERISGPEFPELLDLADHLIVSQHFAGKWTSKSDPSAAARDLWTNGRQAVVITCGSEGCWHLSEQNPDSPEHQPAYRVQTVDTTGCGDVFHGAYASALARGVKISECVRFAAAAAALKATQAGGQAGIPNRKAVEEFLKLESAKHFP
jgi:sulfofructose kinase